MKYETATKSISEKHRSIKLFKCQKCGHLTRKNEKRCECGGFEYREVKK